MTMGIFARIINYFKEAKVEVRHVNWPSRQTTLRYTFLVIGISAGVAVFLGVFDIIFNFLVRTLSF